MSTLSVVLATKNEEENIGPCLESVKNLADETVVFDEFSTDKTREVAKKYGAKVFEYQNKSNFHETKQKAIDKSSCDWILQLDADERVTTELATEIKIVINSSNVELAPRLICYPEVAAKIKEKGVSDEQLQLPKNVELFIRHQKLIERREGKLGNHSSETVAFFVPRINFFLGAPLRHAGVYPDGVIRLFKKGKAWLPGKSVHELMDVDGGVGWLFNDLEHHESPTFSRYLERANRYTDLTAEQFKTNHVSTDIFTLFYYSFVKPANVFFSLYIRHLGILDGMRGFVWSCFSALHFTIAYFKYWQTVKK
ncbi:MAG: Glycosyl transferase family 2 [Candidatus Woesebacteria bacterium GW2011_GWA1_39_21]|uniref:Glycosyl transferase family 2 n=1 Tax=Candidatus Woesebacteria bacterium GW2011_GWA1_39_21 TaxID=1618550 RepID=A0A0G0QM46_9BACT|nr:MAG: Glycosyl transferase family 2 [Candidatus Woesebacteria bacterium GW2011_GWA1_39_21]